MLRPVEVSYREPGDRSALRTALGGADPRERRYGEAISRLIDVAKERAGLAETSRTPMEKVEHLEAAKLALSEVEACSVPGSRFHLVGLAKARAELDRLEQTYRAFGYYRMAGVL